MADTELVLPSGRFAKITPITVADLIIAYHTNPVAQILGLAARTTTLDGKELTPDQWGSMEMNEFIPIMQALSAQLHEANKHVKGIA